jgi:hypothetical protein
MRNSKDLRLVGRTEDGAQLELTDGAGETYFVRISDNLKALVNQPRLVAVTPLEGRTTYSVKEIQSRLRAGESAAAISSTTDWSLEKIEKFSGPIMQERAYVIGIALETPLRREGGAPTLAVATIAQLQPRGVDMTEVEWNTRRNDDGSWTIILQYPNRDGIGEALWNFDLENRTLVADDDGARWINGDDRPSRPSTPSHGMVFGGEPTPAPRLSALSEPALSAAPTLTVVPDNDPMDDDELIEEFENESSEPEPLPIEVARDIPSDANFPSDAQIPSDAKKDGVTKRIKIPSWDDIMFGGSREDKKDE